MKQKVNKNLELSRFEVHAFLNNAQVALAGATIQEDRLNFLVGYAELLEMMLRTYAKLSEDELAFVLVSTAYNVKFPEGKP